MACFAVIILIYCYCNRSANCNSPLQGWNGFLAFCVELLAVDIIIVSIKLSPNVWEMLSLPAAVAIINVLIGLLGGQRESLKDAPIGVVAVPLIHADCIERVITYVKMAHVCEVSTYWWEQQQVFFFLNCTRFVLSINSTLVDAPGQENRTWWSSSTYCKFHR